MKKTLGQHFLTNPLYHRRIVEAAEITAADTIVEIGPGSGLLTDHILKTGARVIAIEKDRDLIAPLREKYKNKNIEIIHDDILKFNPKLYSSIAVKHYSLIGNIPYYITGHLLRTILQSWPQPKTIVLMVQKEVAQRMVAAPPNMNMLAVLVQYYTQPKLITYVKKGNFSPPPKVDSAIVKLTPAVKLYSSKALELASQGFKNPRKKLSNNLPKELLERAGIDPNRRAETITLEEWQSITNISSSPL